MNLSKQVRPAVLWRTSDVISQKVLGFLVSIALARLISPEEFGLVAMLLLFTGLAGVFIDSGFSSALIQRQDHSRTDECTVFWFNLLAGFLVAICLVVAAPSIARLYGHAILEPLIWVMAVNLIIGASTGVHSALMSKKLNFRIPMKAGLTSTVCSGLLAIVLAARGWGVWALAVQTMTSTVIATVLIWTLHDWRPSREFSIGSLSSLYQFGGFMFLSGLLNLLGTQLHTLLIGKFYNASALGYFNRAVSTKDLPQGVIANVFSSVAFPLFSSYSSDRAKLKEGLRTALVAMMAINLPVMFGLLVTADVLIPTLFGTKWISSVPYLQILCGVGALWPLQVANLEALKAQGYSRLFFNLGLTKRALFVSIIVIASQVSVIAIAWGMLAASVLAVFINAYFTRRFLGYGAWSQLCDIGIYGALSLLMAALVFMVGGFFAEISTVAQLAIRTTVGAAFYISACYAFKLEAISLVTNIVTRKQLLVGK